MGGVADMARDELDSGLPRDSQDDPQRPYAVGSGPEGFERESSVSGSSCCAAMWRHWPAASRPSLSLTEWRATANKILKRSAAGKSASDLVLADRRERSGELDARR